MSVFSLSYWITKGYSEDDAKYQIAIRRPNNVLYYINKGYSEDEATLLVKERQQQGGKKRKEMSAEEKRKLSPRCLEFWLTKGLSFEDATLKLSEFQTNFSKKICINKYGDKEGFEIWSQRQQKWQETLKSKSIEEINDINRRKNRWLHLSEDEATLLKQKVSTNVKLTVARRPKEKTKEIFERVIDTKVKLGLCMSPDLHSEFEQYKRQVWVETRKQNLTILENYDKRGRLTYHLDHKFSVWQGFTDSVPPEIIGHICNLVMMPYTDNISKHIKCSIELNTLIQLITHYNDNT
jgi:hypothetical protein